MFTADQLQTEVNKALNREATVIPLDQLRSEELPMYSQMAKQIDSACTDSKLIDELNKDKQEMLKIFVGDPALENFRQKFETVFNALEESYQNELKQAKKCKEYAADLVAAATATQTNQKFANDYAETITIIKTEAKTYSAHINANRKREAESKLKIQKVRSDIVEINKLLEKGVNDIQFESERLISSLTSQRDDTLIIRDKYLTKLAEVRNRSDYAMKELRIQEEENLKSATATNDNKEKIAHTQLEIAKEEARKKAIEAEMELTKKKIDEAVEEREKKTEHVKENVKKIEDSKEIVVLKAKEKEKLHENLHRKRDEEKGSDREKDKQINNLNLLSSSLEQQKAESSEKAAEVKALEQELGKVMREHEIYTQKKLAIIKERKELEQQKGFLEQMRDEEQRTLDEKKRALQMIEGEVDTVFRNKEEINKDIKKSEEGEQHVDDELSEMRNTLKNLENHVRGYQIEAQRLNRVIEMLEKEQEKYGIDASQAHAKYYQTLEELKIKNNLINELQKKNSELDAKLKHQQNLYEAVRSDRNLYSKNLLQAHEEIGDLTKRYTRMSHQVDQLKDELKVKDADLVKQDRGVQKVVRENERNKIEKGRLEKNIGNTDNVIRDQEEQISKLKFIITEAMSEKGRQVKDYEMVVNERDILGSQLIKRNQELSTLYEKIKIAQSNLTKGESHFKDRKKEMIGLQKSLTAFRQELEQTKDQGECITDLKKEISLLEKDVLGQKERVRALQDELDTPMNVHRWRKVEAVDQENYERILKIQALQRRLIAKTEEVSEKDQLIKEKEKLYMELKNVLARQPGPEVQQELVTYKENLKEKSGQMKKMLAELKEAQNLVNVHKFDIDRLNGELSRLRSQYFSKRASEDKEKSNTQGVFTSVGQNISIPYAYRINAALNSNPGLIVGGAQTNPQVAF